MKRVTRQNLQDQLTVLQHRDRTQQRLLDVLGGEVDAYETRVATLERGLTAAKAEVKTLQAANTELVDQLQRAQEFGSSMGKTAADYQALAAQRGTEIRILIEKINQLEAR